MTNNNQIKKIDKILNKEMRCNEMDIKITELKQKLAEANTVNSQLGTEVKSLKKMMPKPTLKVRNSPEKPLNHTEKDLFESDTRIVM